MNLFVGTFKTIKLSENKQNIYLVKTINNNFKNVLNQLIL